MGRPKKIEQKFTSADATSRWIAAVETAINNMIEEVAKKPDDTISGSARKAEMQTIRDTALACKELILEREKMMNIMEDMKSGNKIEEEKDFSSSFAERNAE